VKLLLHPKEKGGFIMAKMKKSNNHQVNPENQLQEDIAEQESRMMDEGGGVVTSGVSPTEVAFRQGEVQTEGEQQ
jgi:predicted enzyme related to lactoylglutathione lyase